MNLPSMTFDDGNVSDIWAASILAKFGLRGVFFLNRHPDSAYAVESLLSLGMLVGNHTEHHLRIDGATDQQVADEVLPWNEQLKAWGASGEYFSYPFSSGRNPLIDKTFKYIYRGTESPRFFEGEIARITVTKKDPEEVKGYLMPLQLHAIDSGQWTDISRKFFIELCEVHTKRLI